MILSGSEIRKQIGVGNIIIDPFNSKQLNPNSAAERVCWKVKIDKFVDFPT